MPTNADPRGGLPPRLRRAVELVYGVDGVVGARIWQCCGRISVGVRGRAAAPASLLHLVEVAVTGLREPGESWDFGILEDSFRDSRPNIADASHGI